MGTRTCLCLNARDGKDKLQITSSEPHLETATRIGPQQDLIQTATTDNEKLKAMRVRVVAIQSLYRGFRTRKLLAAEYPWLGKPSSHTDHEHQAQSDSHNNFAKLSHTHKEPRKKLQQELSINIKEDSKQGPEKAYEEPGISSTYCNPVVKTSEDKLGDFVYDKQPTESDAGLETYKPQVLLNGAIYSGQWSKDGLRHGRGIQIWPDGSKYEGYWKIDMANGKGRLIHGNGDVYIGNWTNDKAQGYGTYRHGDKAEYEGEWKEDKQHGRGVETWPDGARYEGQFEDGKKHGRGVFCWSDGSRYEGDFKDNNIQGHGVFQWQDGRRYEGEWKNNRMHGHGTFSWSDGRSYVGEPACCFDLSCYYLYQAPI